MFVQVGLEGERLVAAVAAEVLEGGVRLHVRAEVGAVGEGFPAVGAAVGLLARVRPHVALEQPGPAEILAAHVAGVAEVVRQDVHGEGGHADVDLVAVRALLGVLAVQRPVRLLVARQVGGGGVVLAALVARVALTGPARLAADARAAVVAAHLVQPRVAAVQGVSALGPAVADEESVVGVAHGHAVVEDVAVVLLLLMLLQLLLFLLLLLLLLLVLLVL